MNAIFFIVLTLLLATQEYVAAQRQGRKAQSITTSKKWMVEFKESVSDVKLGLQRLLDKLHSDDGRPNLTSVYSTLIKGGAIETSDDAGVADLLADPNVLSVTECAKTQLHQYTLPFQPEMPVQLNAPWHLDRLDQARLPLDGSYAFFDNATGVEVFIIDTGIRLAHNEFEGRARCGFEAYQYPDGGNCTDNFGHGTMVASIVGGKTVGVAKKVSLTSVKIAAKDDPYSADSCDFLAGLEYVAKEKKSRPSKPMVVNFSGGFPKAAYLDKAVGAIIRMGVVFVTSAGNVEADACDSSPSGVLRSIVVGSMNVSDSVSFWSGHGPCVDIYAPGESILGAWRNNNSHYKILDGTSFSAPQVAGAAAMFLERIPKATPAMIWNKMQRVAARHKLSNVPLGSPNLLLRVDPGFIKY